MLIETSRLIIRQFKSSDIEELFFILSDPDVMRYSLSGTRTKEGTEKFLNDMIEAYQHHSIAQYAVILKESNKLIGFSGFFAVEINNKKEVELAYRFAKQYWGQGFATEAASACRDYAFKELNLTKLVSTIEPENIASIKVAEKAGLKLEQKTIFHNKSALIYAIEKI